MVDRNNCPLFFCFSCLVCFQLSNHCFHCQEPFYWNLKGEQLRHVEVKGRRVCFALVHTYVHVCIYRGRHNSLRTYTPSDIVRACLLFPIPAWICVSNQRVVMMYLSSAIFPLTPSLTPFFPTACDTLSFLYFICFFLVCF